MKSIILTSVTLFLVAASTLKLTAAENTDKPAAPSRIQLLRDDQKGQLRVLIDGKEAFVYCYGADLDLVHYYPVRSPSGQSMTVQYPERFPHQRSFWFGDMVALAGQRPADFYKAFYSCQDRENPKPPFKNHVRHVEFLPETGTAGQPVIRAKLVWEMAGDKAVLDELRELRVVPLQRGEYLLDLIFTVMASYGDVRFISNATHYAWPYVRMSPQFSGRQGGTITNSEGGVNPKETHGKVAKWVDYSNTVAGKTEGLAVFSHTDNDHPHKWFTRDYGCFGPHRIDARGGKPFTLKRGESLKRRVGILVHCGDVKAGRVAARYDSYVKGQLQAAIK